MDKQSILTRAENRVKRVKRNADKSITLSEKLIWLSVWRNEREYLSNLRSELWRLENKLEMNL